jgi:hypothetical protein
MNKGIFHLLIGGGLFAAVVLFFTLFNKNQIVAEQHLQKAEQKIEVKKFDNDFDKAWNGKPNAQIRKEQEQELAELKADVKLAKQKRDDFDAVFDDGVQNFKDALNDQGDADAPKQKQKTATIEQHKGEPK